MNRRLIVGATSVLVLSLSLLSALDASDKKKGSGGGKGGGGKGGGSMSSGGKGGGSGRSSGGSSGGIRIGGSRSHDDDHHEGGHSSPGRSPFPGGIDIRIGVPTGPRIPVGEPVPPRVVTPVAPAAPAVVNGPGQGGGPELITAPGYLSRAIARIAVGVRHGVYFKAEGGQAAARLPRFLTDAVLGQQGVAVDAPGQPELPLDGPRSIDVAFVVDTTGSMGGEIRELQASLDDIVDDFRGPAGDIDVQFGLVAFRDQGDEYITRHWDFTGDVERFRAALAKLQAMGGGDIPERGDQALFESMIKLSWRAERPDRARVVILCGDASAHGQPARIVHGQYTYETTNEWLLTTAQANHMQIHTVACQGMSADGLAWFRMLAENSGGTYEDLAAATRLREELRRRYLLFENPITPGELAAARAALPPGTRRVAVLPFRNMNGQEKTNFIGDLLQDGFMTELERQPNLAMSSRSLVDYFCRSREFRDKQLAEAAVVQPLGKKLGAELLFTGFYFDFQDKLHLSGQAIDVASGQPVAKSEIVAERGANLFDTRTALARELLTKAGISVAPVESPGGKPAPQRSTTATRYFEKAQELAEQAMRYHAKETIAAPLKEKALSRAARAIEHDPNYLDAYLLQVALLESLERPADVAKALHDGLLRAKSPEVPADDPVRLALEARHTYVVGRDFGGAIKLYEQILDKNPTNRHALWQLANLLGGEWGCPVEYRNATTSRQYIAKIMTLYPTSGMARFFESAGTTLVHDPSPAT